MFMWVGTFYQKFLKPEGVLFFVHAETLVKKALKFPDFRVPILELARFTLGRTTPSVARGGRRVLGGLRHELLFVLLGTPIFHFTCLLAYGDASGLRKHEDVNE